MSKEINLAGKTLVVDSIVELNGSRQASRGGQIIKAVRDVTSTDQKIFNLVADSSSITVIPDSKNDQVINFSTVIKGYDSPVISMTSDKIPLICNYTVSSSTTTDIKNAYPEGASITANFSGWHRSNRFTVGAEASVVFQCTDGYVSLSVTVTQILSDYVKGTVNIGGVWDCRYGLDDHNPLTMKAYVPYSLGEDLVFYLYNNNVQKDKLFFTCISATIARTENQFANNDSPDTPPSESAVWGTRDTIEPSASAPYIWQRIVEYYLDGSFKINTPFLSEIYSIPEVKRQRQVFPATSEMMDDGVYTETLDETPQTGKDYYIVVNHVGQVATDLSHFPYADSEETVVLKEKTGEYVDGDSFTLNTYDSVQDVYSSTIYSFSNGSWEILTAYSNYYNEILIGNMSNVFSNVQGTHTVVNGGFDFFKNVIAEQITAIFYYVQGAIYGGNVHLDSDNNPVFEGKGFYLGANGQFICNQATLQDCNVEGRLNLTAQDGTSSAEIIHPCLTTTRGSSGDPVGVTINRSDATHWKVSDFSKQFAPNQFVSVNGDVNGTPITKFAYVTDDSAPMITPTSPAVSHTTKHTSFTFADFNVDYDGEIVEYSCDIANRLAQIYIISSKGSGYITKWLDREEASVLVGDMDRIVFSRPFEYEPTDGGAMQIKKICLKLYVGDIVYIEFVKNPIYTTNHTYTLTPTASTFAERGVSVGSWGFEDDLGANKIKLFNTATNSDFFTSSYSVNIQGKQPSSYYIKYLFPTTFTSYDSYDGHEILPNVVYNVDATITYNDSLIEVKRISRTTAGQLVLYLAGGSQLLLSPTSLVNIYGTLKIAEIEGGLSTKDLTPFEDDTYYLGIRGKAWKEGHFTEIFGSLIGSVTGDVTGNVNSAGTNKKVYGAVFC